MQDFLKPTRVKWLMFVLAFVCETGLALSAREPTAADKEVVVRVAAKIFEVADPVEGWAWPPLLGIMDDNEVNAFATLKSLKPGEKPPYDNPVVWLDVPLGKSTPKEAAEAEKSDKPKARPQPLIVLKQGFLDQVVKGRDVYLAETLGHELSHILLRHVDNYDSAGSTLVAFAFSRDHESDADTMGMKLALKADYPYDELISSMKIWRQLNDSNSIKHLAATHPGWTDRIAHVDEKQPKLWSSLSAFENGVYFLTSENYLLAERCFAQVIKDMPRCYEAWANRGYCRLMRYCDGLQADDLKEMALNQVVVGGFYHRAGSIDDRGINTELWFEAVGDIREALRLKEALILPKANLALAYLVHPNGKQLGKAAELYEQLVAALKDGKPDEEISPADHAALLVNAGVTELANGDSKAADKFFDQAVAVYQKSVKAPPTGTVKSALLYSQASQMASSSQPQDRRKAIEVFEEYLSTTNPAVTWWELAFGRYKQLCSAEKTDPKTTEQLALPRNLQYRPVVSLVVGENKTISLNEPVTTITDLIGPGSKTPLVKRSNVHRLKYDKQGIELLCSERLIAIRLKSDKAPPLVLQASGAGGATIDVRVGMPFSELEKSLEAEANAWDGRYGTQESIVYHYFSRLGFGVRIDDENKITEIIIAQIPERSIAK